MSNYETGKTSGPASTDVVYAPTVESVMLTDDGVFPNNGKLPLLIYRKVLNTGVRDLASHVQAVFAEHNWGDSWIDSVYDYHHYHSTAHEVLAVCSGQARILFGGEHGMEQTVSAGDVIVIPAGVSHKKLGSEGNLGPPNATYRVGDPFAVVGAYPQGQSYDMCYGKREERPEADRRIVSVPLPESDPLYGPDGPLLEHWQT